MEMAKLFCSREGEESAQFIGCGLSGLSNRKKHLPYTPLYAYMTPFTIWNDDQRYEILYLSPIVHRKP